MKRITLADGRRVQVDNAKPSEGPSPALKAAQDMTDVGLRVAVVRPIDAHTGTVVAVYRSLRSAAASAACDGGLAAIPVGIAVGAGCIVSLSGAVPVRALRGA